MEMKETEFSKNTYHYQPNSSHRFSLKYATHRRLRQRKDVSKGKSSFHKYINLTIILMIFLLIKDSNTAQSPCSTQGAFPYGTMPLDSGESHTLECPDNHNRFRFVITFKLSKLPTTDKE